jgi:hypothetical protein
MHKIATQATLGKYMFIHGAKDLGMTQAKCLDLLERTDDTLDFLISSLTYLLHAEKIKPLPNPILITEFDALKKEALNVQNSLPGSHVNNYQRALKKYGRHNQEINSIVESYMTKSLAK